MSENKTTEVHSVSRFDPDISYGGVSSTFAIMVERADGGYVQFEDYERLAAELRKAVEILETTVDGNQPSCQWWIDEVARLRAFVDSVRCRGNDHE